MAARTALVTNVGNTQPSRGTSPGPGELGSARGDAGPSLRRRQDPIITAPDGVTRANEPIDSSQPL